MSNQQKIQTLLEISKEQQKKGLNISIGKNINFQLDIENIWNTIPID